MKTIAHRSLSVPAILLIILAGSAPAVAGITLDTVGQTWQTFVQVFRPAGLVLTEREDFKNLSMPLVDKRIYIYTSYGPSFGSSLAEQQIITYIGPAAVGETAPELVLSGKAQGGSTAGHGFTSLSYHFTLDQPHPYTLTGPTSDMFFSLSGPDFYAGGGSSGILAPGEYQFFAGSLGMGVTYSLTISAVPEPSMGMIAAVAGVLLQVRRRRR